MFANLTQRGLSLTKCAFCYTSALTLAACTTPQSVGVRVETVNVPVPVRCVDPAAIPAEPPHVKDTLTGDARVDILIIGESVLALRKAYEELRALVVPACTTTP